MNRRKLKGLNLTSFGRTATIVRQWSNVNDFSYFDICRSDCANSGLTSVARSLDINLDLTETEVVGYLSTVGGCCLCCIRGVLFRALEIHLTS